MSNDSETVKVTKNAEETDDLCTVEYIEIVPLERPSDDCHASEFIHPNIVPPPEDLQQVNILQQMKQEVTDENDDGDPHCCVKQEPVDDYETQGSHFTQHVSVLQAYIQLLFAIVFCVILFSMVGKICRFTTVSS